MSYDTALIATGHALLDYQSFGDYQGTWYALMNINGTLSLISGSYGSCSGCDAFESEFSYDNDNTPEYKEHLKRFGQQYIDNNLVDIAKEIETQKVTAEWDMEAPAVIAWLERIQHDMQFKKKLEAL